MIQKQAPAAYDPKFMQQLLNDLQTLERNSYQKRMRIDIDPDADIVMTSPNGTRYAITVSNAGALVFTAL